MNLLLNNIIQLPEIKVVGLEIICSTNEKENYFSARNLWQVFNKQLYNIPTRINRNEWRKFGLYYGSNGKIFNYVASIPVSEFMDIPSTFIQKTIPSLTYLEFIHIGSIEYIYSSIKFIYIQYLKKMNLSVINPDKIGFNHFEEYGKEFNWTKPNSKLKILIPVDLTEFDSQKRLKTIEYPQLLKNTQV